MYIFIYVCGYKKAVLLPTATRDQITVWPLKVLK